MATPIRAHRFPLFCTLFNKGGNRRVFSLPGAGGDHFHCAVEPSPGHIRGRFLDNFPGPQHPSVVISKRMALTQEKILRAPQGC